MEKQTLVKIIGIFVLVVMAISMLAFSMLYMDKAPTTTTDPTSDFPQVQDTSYSYTMTFDATAVKELAGMRFGAMTSHLNKAEIDSAMLKIEGVSKISSQFHKSASDSNSWVYLAEVSLKKGADAQVTAKSMSENLYFDQAAGFDAMKYATITVPTSLMVHNVDLNMDKNYSFPVTTLSALVRANTVAGDTITVSGNATLQGKAIIKIELIEQKNITQEEAMQELFKQMQQDQNKPVVDVNTLVIPDTNVPLPSDSNA